MEISSDLRSVVWMKNKKQATNIVFSAGLVVMTNLGTWLRPPRNRIGRANSRYLTEERALG